jgi:hypothetical protein
VACKLPPARAPNEGVAIHRAVVWAILATMVAAALAGWDDPYFTWYRIMAILALQLVVIVHPLSWTLRLYRTHQDFMHPAMVGSLTFVVFHILFNPIAIANLDILQIRGLSVTEGSDFLTTIILSYVVVAVAWFSYYFALSWVTRWAPVRPTPSLGSSRLTLAFLAVGLGYVAVGMLANIAVLGGLSSYLDKMLHFYERWDAWELANIQGGSKWTIMMKFLPPGLILLASGFWLYKGGSKVMLSIVLSLAVLANIFLSNATGGRGTTLMVAFYSLPLFNVYINKLTVKTASLFGGALIGISYVLGNFRAASYYGVMETSSPIDLVANIDKIVAFVVQYLTDFVGTITMVSEVRTSGVFWGGTAFSGLTGLLGGPTPLTTEVEMWWRITGKYILNNPRFGPPGELFFNFSWPGVVIGMALIGLAVGVLSRGYTRALSERSVRAA